MTRGPVNGKEFSSSLGVTAEDLLDVAEKMLEEKAAQAAEPGKAKEGE
jgi:hypothetical protein